MSLKGRILSILTLAVAFTAFGSISYAQTTTPAPQDNGIQKPGEGRGFHREGRGGGFGHGPGGLGELRGIDLTDAQKQQIKSIMDSNKPDETSMTQMRTLMEAKRNGTLTADQEAQLKTLREQGRAKMQSVHEQILSVLTPEQKQQIEQRRQEMKQRREQWKQQRQQQQQKDSTVKTTDN